MSPAWQTYRYWRRLLWLFFFGSVVWFFPVAITSEAIGVWNKDVGHVLFRRHARVDFCLCFRQLPTYELSVSPMRQNLLLRLLWPFFRTAVP
jgi:hypothetical protein